MKIEITEELGEEIYQKTWGKDTDITINDEGFTVVDKLSNYCEHRWADTCMVVLERLSDSKLFGMLYDEPSTEMQEDQGGFCYSTPELRSVTAEEVTVTSYKFEKE